MKKLYILLALFTGISGIVKSQSITAFTVTPANPTTNDTIQILIECTFPSGGCEGTVTGSAQVGNTIYADGFHCMGMLTVICTDYDTVIIPPLTVGQYSFIYTLIAGQGIPCTPGIVPEDTDTLIFDVDNATGLENSHIESPFVVKTEGNKFFIRNQFNEKGVISIFSSDGKLLISQSFNSEEIEIARPETPGIYMLAADIRGKRYTFKVVILR